MRIVKSARRALDLLEYFATIRRAASVSDVERALDIPQSSASVLLRSMAALGYLEYVPADRTFRPTLRVAKLGDWIEHGLPGPLTTELEALRNELHETIILGRQHGAQVEFIYYLMAERAVQFFARRNSLEPMSLSAVGRVLLAQLPPATARGIIRRNNAEARSPREIVDENQLMKALETCTQTGFAETDPAFGGVRDFHVVAMPLPRTTGEPLAIGVAGPLERMKLQSESIKRALSDWIARSAPDYPIQ